MEYDVAGASSSIEPAFTSAPDTVSEPKPFAFPPPAASPSSTSVPNPVAKPKPFAFPPPAASPSPTSTPDPTAKRKASAFPPPAASPSSTPPPDPAAKPKLFAPTPPAASTSSTPTSDAASKPKSPRDFVEVAIIPVEGASQEDHLDLTKLCENASDPSKLVREANLFALVDGLRHPIISPKITWDSPPSGNPVVVVKIPREILAAIPVAVLDLKFLYQTFASDGSTPQSGVPDNTVPITYSVVLQRKNNIALKSMDPRIEKMHNQTTEREVPLLVVFDGPAPHAAVIFDIQQQSQPDAISRISLQWKDGEIHLEISSQQYNPTTRMLRIRADIPFMHLKTAWRHESNATQKANITFYSKDQLVGWIPVDIQHRRRPAVIRLNALEFKPERPEQQIETVTLENWLPQYLLDYRVSTDDIKKTPALAGLKITAQIGKAPSGNGDQATYRFSWEVMPIESISPADVVIEPYLRNLYSTSNPDSVPSIYTVPLTTQIPDLPQSKTIDIKFVARPAIDILGIDFGTTNSSMAFRIANSSDSVDLNPHPLPTPLLVARTKLKYTPRKPLRQLEDVRHEYEIHAFTNVGSAADFQHHIKPRMLRPPPNADEEIITFNDLVKMKISDVAEDYIAMMLRRLRHSPQTQGRPVNRVSFTYPVTASAKYRATLTRVIKAALKREGYADDIPIESNYDEASAVGFYFLSINKPQLPADPTQSKIQNYLVFDYGGGTTDLCMIRLVLSRTPALRSSTIVGIAGIEECGGEDVTRSLASQLAAHLQKDWADRIKRSEESKHAEITTTARETSDPAPKSASPLADTSASKPVIAKSQPPAHNPLNQLIPVIDKLAALRTRLDWFRREDRFFEMVEEEKNRHFGPNAPVLPFDSTGQCLEQVIEQAPEGGHSEDFQYMASRFSDWAINSNPSPAEISKVWLEKEFAFIEQQITENKFWVGDSAKSLQETNDAINLACNMINSLGRGSTTVILSGQASQHGLFQKRIREEIKKQCPSIHVEVHSLSKPKTCVSLGACLRRTDFVEIPVIQKRILFSSSSANDDFFQDDSPLLEVLPSDHPLNQVKTFTPTGDPALYAVLSQPAREFDHAESPTHGFILDATFTNAKEVPPPLRSSRLIMRSMNEHGFPQTKSPVSIAVIHLQPNQPAFDGIPAPVIDALRKVARQESVDLTHGYRRICLWAEDQPDKPWVFNYDVQ
jgi:hypothetical protein